MNESVCNSKQIWNPDECWWECKELNDSRKNGYIIINPSTWDCECNKACKIDEYLESKNSSYGKAINW